MVNLNDIQELVQMESRGTGRKDDPLILCKDDIKAIDDAGLIERGSGRIHMPAGFLEIEEDDEAPPMFSSD